MTEFILTEAEFHVVNVNVQTPKKENFHLKPHKITELSVLKKFAV